MATGPSRPSLDLAELSPGDAGDAQSALRFAQTVTLLFSDVEGSTRILQQLGPGYAEILLGLRDITRRAVAENGGREVDTAGDGFFAAFPTARGAVAAAAALQREIANRNWPTPLRVRVGIHTGEPAIAGGSFVGIDVHRTARICGAAQGGQVLVSQATRDLVSRELPANTTLLDLGPHRLKDLDTPEHLFQLILGDLPTAPAGIKVNVDRQGILPVQLTSFVGRDREMASVIEMIRKHRLVTLTGPGGTGKTRLAIAAATEQQFADGVVFVGLASAREAPGDLDLPLVGACCARSCEETCELVSRSIASALGVKENPMQPVFESVKDAVRHQSLLLVLDNFEQLLDAAQLVSELLMSSPRLHILVTSRSPLHVSGEQEYRVPPLSLPPLRGDRQPSMLARHGSVVLFAERARAVNSEFELTEEYAPIVAEICVRLDGLPLAIELAAARTKILPPAAILRRLSDRLRLLTGGGRDLPERHQTLRQAIAWSYELLNEEEQACFRRMSAFVGGFTLEAAEYICSRSGAIHLDALEAVSALVDKSLLRQEEGSNGEPRFEMLETIREFGREALREAGEIESVWRTHAEYYVTLVEEAEPHLVASRTREWLDRLEAEHENLRAALIWSEENDEADIGLRIAGSLLRFWLIRGHLTEGRERLERLVSLPSAHAPTRVRAAALNGLGTIIHEISDFNAARQPLEESLEIWRKLGDGRGTGSALNNLSWIAAMQGDNDGAKAAAEESLQLHRGLGDKRGVAVALHNLSFVATQQSRMDDARALLDESIRLRTESGDVRGVAYEYTMLAWIEVFDGHLERAEALADSALEVLMKLDDRQLVPWAYDVKGRRAIELGRYEEAREFLEISVKMWREAGNRGGFAEASAELAYVKCCLGETDSGRALAEEALALIRPCGSAWFTASALFSLAQAERLRGNHDRALLLFDECLEIRERLGDRIGIAKCQDGITACTTN